MSGIKILTEDDLRAEIRLDLAAVKCVEEAFKSLATKPVVMPPILRLDIAENNGEVDVKTAYIPGLDSFAIKISPGFFNNPALGLPATNGIMVLFSALTGVVESVLLDNGYLTNVRTAAAGAVGARHLSREDSESVAILGTGLQAELQLEAITLVRNIKRASIWGRDAQKASELASKLSQKLDIEVSAHHDVGEVTSNADIIVTTTPTHEPILHSAHIQAGQHITAMGSDAEHKNEIAAEVIAKVNYICDRLSQVQSLGELHHAIEAGAIDSETVFPEIGQVITGQFQGRKSESDITLFDSTGTGIQDTAIATLAYNLCLAKGAGTTLGN